MSKKSRKRKKRKINRKLLSVILALAGPALAMIYLTLDHIGLVDRLTKQDIIEEAIDRLANTSGFPVGWIYNDSIDKIHFDQVYKLIRKNTKSKSTLDLLSEGYTPTLILTAGQPFQLIGINDKWPQKERALFTDNHPILLIFNATREGGKGKAERVGSLGDLKEWTKSRKLNQVYIIGGIILGFLSIAITLIQHKIE